MKRIALFGLCLAVTVTAGNIKPERVVPIEDPEVYPCEEQVVEYIPEPYIPQFRQRPRYDKDIIFLEEPKMRYQPLFNQPNGKMDPRPPKDKTPAIQIYLI